MDIIEKIHRMARGEKFHKNLNTKLARKLAEHYETLTGENFPGGIDNAKIRRSRLSRRQTLTGCFSWSLEMIDKGNNHTAPLDFGSPETATHCATHPESIDYRRA